MTRKFLESLDQEGGDVVPGGTYTLEVADARALEDKPFIWMDLKIVGGPDANRVISVGLNVPDDTSSRGAIFHFKKKIRGFLPQLMPLQVFNLPDDEQPEAIAEAILGSTIEADLSVQSGGDYDGSQQLDETRQIADVQVQSRPIVAETEVKVAPAAAPVAVAAAPATVGDNGDGDVPF